MIRPLAPVSVVIPARDERGALPKLIDGVAAALEGRRHEIIVVDDGSRDGSAELLAALSRTRPHLRTIRHPRSCGQSAAVRSGVRAAAAPLIVTLDGDGQNPPDQIPLLLAPFDAPGAEGLGLVQGQRTGRRDTLARRLASSFANGLRSRLLRDGVRDSACGLKAFRREAYLALPWFDHIHRFMPALMLRDGWQVETVDVTHRPRVQGRSKYTNLGRGLVGLPDLLGVAWLLRRTGAPTVVGRAAAGGGGGAEAAATRDPGGPGGVCFPVARIDGL